MWGRLALKASNGLLIQIETSVKVGAVYPDVYTTTALARSPRHGRIGSGWGSPGVALWSSAMRSQTLMRIGGGEMEGETTLRCI